MTPGLVEPFATLYTATSTRLSIEVSIVPGCRWFWLLSTPMASLPLSLAAWYTPMPVPPAAAKTTSAPLANCALASSPPRAGSFQAAPVVPVMLANTSALGLAYFDALLVAALELADQRNVHAADEADLAALAGHRRHQPDQEAALLLLEHHRLHVGQVDHHVDDGELQLGEVLGHLLDARGLAKPTPMIGLAPRSAMRRMACSRCDSLAISNSRKFLPVSFFQRSMPRKAASLKDLSNLPPMS